MVYLVAKNSDRHGCYAWKTEPGKHITAIKKKLCEDEKTSDLEIVTISRPTAYGEYAPYTFVHSEEEFIEKAYSLAD